MLVFLQLCVYFCYLVTKHKGGNLAVDFIETQHGDGIRAQLVESHQELREAVLPFRRLQLGLVPHVCRDDLYAA
jgi:hypothetical protein